MQMERIIPGHTDPLSFAILKAKMNADECGRLRFLTELQAQEVLAVQCMPRALAYRCWFFERCKCALQSSYLLIGAVEGAEEGTRGGQEVWLAHVGCIGSG
jgi:hypothetical protein